MKINLFDLPAVYINLAHQKDRKKQTEEQLSRWGHQNFSRIEASYRQPDEWPWKGQNRSYTEAYSKHQPPFIAFEDDIILNYDLSTLEVPDDADLLYLGGQGETYVAPESGHYVNFRASETKFTNIIKVLHMQSNHALVFLSQTMVDEYLEMLKQDLRADVILCQLSEKYNFYAVQPVLFYQEDEDPHKAIHNSYTRVNNFITREKF